MQRSIANNGYGFTQIIKLLLLFHNFLLDKFKIILYIYLFLEVISQ